MESTLKFQRGDIYFIRLGSGTGSEQSGTRPAVILQNDVGNAHSPTLIVATLTSKTEKKAAQPTHCLVEPEKLEPSIVQAEQIFTIDKSRVQNFAGHLTPEEMSRVDDAVKISLALNPMGSIQKLKPIIRSTAAYAPPEVVDGKPPVYPYTPIKSDFEDAETVEEMMLYVYEGYGAQRIATYLNNAGYRARSGKCWHPGSLRGMVGNLTYMGVLRCGDARSELIPELQIIPQEEFEAAQRIREDRSAHAAEEAEHHVPLRTRGQALLSNNVYCGHCGARLALTTSRKWRKLSDGTLDDTLRIRYICYGKLRKQTDCTGQTGYTMHILDEIIDKMVRQIFSRLRGIPKEQLITSRYAKETAERKNHLQALQAERDKAEKDLLALKTEILAVIKGESAFPKDTLAEMIAAQEKKHTELETLCEEASAELERNAELMANVSQLYEELISYADLYDSASFEAKKMIVSQLIRRVEVYRGYQIHVDFNFDLAQYLENSDELAC